MEEKDKAQKLKDRANVTLEEAEEALKACDGDLLDAMVYLEKLGKVNAPETMLVTTSIEEHTSFENVQDKVDRYNRETSNSLGGKIKHLIRILFDTITHNFLSVIHKGVEIIKIPLWIVAIIIFFSWYLSIAVFIISLFFGVRYSLSGRDDLTEANKLIGKATDAADYVKDKFDKL
ncbi:MAG: hypothetical protein K6E28_07380 [Eubacterium sp.]|nr:hypothetical protein [Eubacterium sp.]